MNYYERHLGDYARDTGHLSMLEHGAYSLLLDRYYITERGIPAAQAHRIARARVQDELDAVDAVLAEFFTLNDGVWIQARADGEIELARKKINAARENGKLGGRPRKGVALKQEPNEKPEDNQKEPSGFLLGYENETQAKALQTPDTNLQALTKEPTALVVEANASTTYKVPNCPTVELLAMYHQHLAALPAVEIVNDGRKRAMSLRWREVCAEDKLTRAAALEWFEWFFKRVSASDFLMGKVPEKSGRIWRADIDFLFTPSKFVKIVEGKYHEQGVAA